MNRGRLMKDRSCVGNGSERVKGEKDPRQGAQ